jgi:hypothetical protein
MKAFGIGQNTIFLYVPAPGDTVVVCDKEFNLFRVRVHHVEHQPDMAPSKRLTPSKRSKPPVIVIIVEVVEELT